jgi:sugar-specific transcriptional regulator TrmB
MRFTDKAIQPIIQEMMALGFSDYEARVYIALARSDALTVYEISKLTGVPRPNVYSAVERLMQRNAAHAVGKRPARYLAVQPKTLFGDIRKATDDRCAELTKQLAAFDAIKDNQFAYTVTGTQQVRKKLDQLICQSKRTIWFKATDDLIAANYRALKSAASRGVKIVIVLFGEIPTLPKFPRNVSLYLHDNNGIRLGIADQQFTIVSDGEEAFIANIRGEYYGIHTQSPPIVRVSELLLRKDVYLAEILKKFGPMIEEEYGPLLAALRRKFLVGEELKAFNATLSKLTLRHVT